MRACVSSGGISQHMFHKSDDFTACGACIILTHQGYKKAQAEFGRQKRMKRSQNVDIGAKRR